MHNKLPTFFLFIDIYDEQYIRNLDKKIAIIFRNYTIKPQRKLILKIKETCKKDKRKLFLSNNLKLALNLSLDGVYLPAFNKNLNTNNISKKNKFIIIGSAHSVQEIKIKEKQGANTIFIAPLFKTKKNKKFLNTIRFNLLALTTTRKIIALGGITVKNLKSLRITKSIGFAGISFFKNDNKIKL